MMNVTKSKRNNEHNSVNDSQTTTELSKRIESDITKHNKGIIEIEATTPYRAKQSTTEMANETSRFGYDTMYKIIKCHISKTRFFVKY